MLNEVLDYIGLDLNKKNKCLECSKSEFNITKSYDNSMLYKVYKMLPIKDIDILIGMSDRTTDIKERYMLAKPINEFIVENRSDFENLVKLAKIEDIKKIEEMQNDFNKKSPYFIKYDKNYLWQIYYSKENNKYFMLFPAREEGETSALFYLIKNKLKNSNEKIYVPVCKEELSEEFLLSTEVTDLENYIWLFTKKWPNIYEVEKNKKKRLYIIGESKVKEDFESKYRIEIKNKEEADNEYTLFKALFILSTETSYKFNTVIDDNGNLRLEFDDEIIQIDNLTSFISRQAMIQKQKTKEIKDLIDISKNSLEKVKKEIKELNDIYLMQEKQIVMFLNCKKSIFKRIKYFFKKPINSIHYSIDKKENSNQENLVVDKKIEDISKTISYTLSDLVKICKDNNKIESEYKNINADLGAMKNKKKNLENKIKNAKIYLEEIEEHKKSIFEFWKFTKKDENPYLNEGEELVTNKKIDATFNLDEDFEEFAEKVDFIQKQKLSINECNSIFCCRYILNSINSILLGEDEEKNLTSDLKKLKEQYTGNKRTEIFGDIQEDYTKIKKLKSKKHRENKKNIYSILRVNEQTTLEEYKNSVENIARYLNEAFNKIISITCMPVYFTEYNPNKFIIAEIDPKKIDLKNLKEKTIYKKQINENDHVLYFSNIAYYDNLNKTLPNGMDESTNILFKANKIKNTNEKFINILEENGLYDVKINKIKVIICD